MLSQKLDVAMPCLVVKIYNAWGGKGALWCESAAKWQPSKSKLHLLIT